MQAPGRPTERAGPAKRPKVFFTKISGRVTPLGDKTQSKVALKSKWRYFNGQNVSADNG